MQKRGRLKNPLGKTANISNSWDPLPHVRKKNIPGDSKQDVSDPSLRHIVEQLDQTNMENQESHEFLLRSFAKEFIKIYLRISSK